MNITEANIKIIREGQKVTSISVFMPIWDNQNDYGNIIVRLPLLGIETIAKNENDVEEAVKEAISSFCAVAERFGQGIESELMALGWEAFDDATGEPVLGYNVDDADSVIDRIMQTGEKYVNPHLEIA